MVDTSAGETLREIAARYGRSYETLRTEWSRHPAWPSPVGKRGRAYVYDPTAVNTFVLEELARTAPSLEPNVLYTAREIAEATGLSATTIRTDVSRGRWPAPDDTSGPAFKWKGSTVTAALQGRRGYRRG
ncbi:hypothetical protein [Streptomyces sp. NPDC096153]|uniref:helix-turn-helix transcriptional regulator n=1 Tax=Streptomyces sp. NPDC096153 TaxID=3155548 RepID=UPI00331720B2